MQPFVREMKYSNKESHIIPRFERRFFGGNNFLTLDIKSSNDVLRWIDWTTARPPFRISTVRILKAIKDVLALFRGDFPGYFACDTRYHDLAHTLRLFPPFCQIAIALFRKHPATILPRELELGLLAVLLHDSGYIRKEGDCNGTGAKYTFHHIDRSVDFARTYLSSFDYQEQDLLNVEHMIRCTGIKPKLKQINFTSEGYRLLGYALGTADLLSQMSDPYYLRKLSLLFSELEEAYNYAGPNQLGKMEVQRFKSYRDLIQHTPFFFKKVAGKCLENMGAVYRLLENPETGLNPYLKRVQENMKGITQRSIPHNCYSYPLGQANRRASGNPGSLQNICEG